MKTIATTFLSLLLVVAATAGADFKTVDQAYEVPFEHLRMPEAPNGLVTFRQCEECEEFTLPVTTNTRYLINGEIVELKDFRRVMFRVRRQSANVGNAATVLRNLETDTAVSISVYL